MDWEELAATIETKMIAGHVARPTIQAFLAAVRQVDAGQRGWVPETAIEPVTDLPRLDRLEPPTTPSRTLHRQLVIIKLNGGLGTSMGLDRAKSLIPVRGSDTFLDFIVHQVLHLRSGGRVPAFYLMDSFSTQPETLAHLSRYAELGSEEPLDFLQNRVPKLDAQTLEPVDWPADPQLEWCPPGHGDLYPSLLASGLLSRLRERDIRYAFVSNSDNLGATVDLQTLDYFARSGLSFLMEVAERTPADRKGGHLARRRDTGRLLLRESAQTPKDDESSFQDLERHRYFNTNNLWIRLDRLEPELERHGGVLPLPLITNSKTVDPRDPASPKVLQLESAMGAAIECFDQSGAIVVPRSRFSPVKTTSDLLALRSDAYRLTEDHRLILVESRNGQPPWVELDPGHYRVLSDFERAFAAGPPSLLCCRSFRVIGPLSFADGVVCEGDVEFINSSSAGRTVPSGHYTDRKVTV